MNTKIKNVLKYSVMLAITGFLLWLSFQNIEVGEGESKLEFIANAWRTADKFYLMLSAIAAVLSHVIRAERWKILLNPLGHRLSLKYGFISVMVGYFINLAIPRGGEVSRCYTLYRLNKTPVDVSLGTVVAERVIDLVFLLVLIGVSFLIQLDQLVYFFEKIDLQQGTSQGGGLPVFILLGLVLFLLGLFFIAFYIYKTRRYFALKMLSRSRSVIKGIKSGVLVVFKLDNKGLFIFHSLFIWLLYYLMSYFILMAFPETEHIGLLAALTIFVIGGIAVAIPLPGGAGSYHVLVPLGLVILYGLEQDIAVAYTFILHGWQTVIIILLGAFSMLLSQYYGSKQKDLEQNKTT